MDHEGALNNIMHILNLETQRANAAENRGQDYNSLGGNGCNSCEAALVLEPIFRAAVNAYENAGGNYDASPAKKTAGDVLAIIDCQGLGYALTDYMCADSIEDGELKDAWKQAQDAIEKIRHLTEEE